jgi:hypothetical protein
MRTASHGTKRSRGDKQSKERMGPQPTTSRGGGITGGFGHSVNGEVNIKVFRSRGTMSASRLLYRALCAHGFRTRDTDSQAQSFVRTGTLLIRQEAFRVEGTQGAILVTEAFTEGKK